MQQVQGELLIDETKIALPKMEPHFRHNSGKEQLPFWR